MHPINNIRTVAALVLLMSGSAVAFAQMMPGGGQSGMGRQSNRGQPGDEPPSAPAAEKPDAAAKKAYAAAMKSLAKAKAYEAAAGAAVNADKRAKESEKMADAYSRALDQFTEALSNNGTLADAWNNVGYIHLKLGAYMEAVDDYNHTLALKPGLTEAIEHRGEAYLALDRLEDVKSAYMDLFNHDPPLAGQLMVAMQSWLDTHRRDAGGVRAADVDAFGKWMADRAAHS
ncbi:MAG: hypothetical protein NVSMB10_15760 [Steroidobacteraceae bacterium]